MEATKMILKRSPERESSWELWCEEKIIETYSADEAIDFDLLMKHLIEDDLKTNYRFTTDIENPSSSESRLISVLTRIFEKHQKAIDDYRRFIAEKSSDSND